MIQFYKGIRLGLINRKDYKRRKAKRFTLGGTNQNVWIPNKHLESDGKIKDGENIDYVFRKAQRQLELAGHTEAIPGIKRRSMVEENKHSFDKTICPTCASYGRVKHEGGWYCRECGSLE
ncbi:hypothetical protein J22TS1_44060 [Siminovitchia terrae]|uniref:hypothetical protein n=1 Tax=Siminovitchia terrae TaxID=1914933 RepID=UPI001B018FA3|nr:hypothetical protein [Siminovitchia terrae]GIN93355.1 hypothetical protein J22TS1_44060 [Siminovitchia terrae]